MSLSGAVSAGRHITTAEEEDPFMSGASMGKTRRDDDDPFDLERMAEDLQMNLLPQDLLPLPLQFCDAKTVLIASQVNRAWHEAAESDKVWKALCLTKWDSDVLHDNKRYMKNIGYKVAYFAGVCRMLTVVAHNPNRHSYTFMVYPGATVRDLLHSVGLQKAHYHRLSSTSFTDSFAEAIDELEGKRKGLSSSLASTSVSDIFTDSQSTVEVENIRDDKEAVRRAASRVQQGGGDDDEGESLTARVAASSELEAAARDHWKKCAVERLAKLPKFIWTRMKSHYPGLEPGPKYPAYVPRAAPRVANAVLRASDSALKEARQKHAQAAGHVGSPSSTASTTSQKISRAAGYVPPARSAPGVSPAGPPTKSAFTTSDTRRAAGSSGSSSSSMRSPPSGPQAATSMRR